MDCVFLGYAFRSIGYRFLVVKSEVSDMHVGTIMESNDATFFEDICPMKDTASSSNQELPSSSSQDLVQVLNLPLQWNNLKIMWRTTMKFLQEARDR